ncbi:MAG TPA: hypothetical protein VL201_01090 [Patescibacteria group bacterium]|jgi:hypothetical protein|nr:hypothetical protein [Patescibacteria group bacterium]
MHISKKISLSLCLIGIIAQGRSPDNIRKEILTQGEKLKNDLIHAGYSKDIADQITDRIIFEKSIPI